MTGTRLILIRHGEAVANVEKLLMSAKTCRGLSEKGRNQVERLRDRWLELPEFSADAFYASHVKRAMETGEIVAPAIGVLEMKIEPRFAEHDPGPECDGLSYEEFVSRHGNPDWEGDPYAVFFPGGETIADFQHRVGIAVQDVLREHTGETVVVACHGGVVDAVVRSALRLPQTGQISMYTKNASITEVVHDKPGRWRLIRYNDTAHLAALAEDK